VYKRQGVAHPVAVFVGDGPDVGGELGWLNCCPLFTMPRRAA
jgi:hypothetical protein